MLIFAKRYTRNGLELQVLRQGGETGRRNGLKILSTLDLAQESSEKTHQNVLRRSAGSRIPDETKQAIISDYLAGNLSQKAIGAKHGVGRKGVGLIVKRAGIPPRQPFEPERKGRPLKEVVSYYSLHARVRKERGKPSHCENCETSDPAKYYDWANLTGNYADVNDYIRLCRRCHVLMDGTWRNLPRLENAELRESK